MKPLEPRGPVEIWNITSTTKDGKAIVGFSFHENRMAWVHSREPAPEVMDTLVHEMTHLTYPEYGEREVEEWTKAEMSELAVDGLIHYIEVLEQAKGWWRIRRKMGNYALKCWGYE